MRDDVFYEGEGAIGSSGNAPAPAGLMVTSDTKDSVSLSWNAVTGTTSYKVEYPMTGSISWFLPRQAYPSTSNTLGRLDDNTSDDFQVGARGDVKPYSTTYVNPGSTSGRKCASRSSAGAKSGVPCW